jgi:hypothetical protein
LVLALAATRCSSSKGDNKAACADVTAAEKNFQTFLQNHPVGGAPDPQSQIPVLSQMLDGLNAALDKTSSEDVANELEDAMKVATQMKADIAAGKPVTTAALISDFNNLDSLCGELLNATRITAP